MNRINTHWWEIAECRDSIPKLVPAKTKFESRQHIEKSLLFRMMIFSSLEAPTSPHMHHLCLLRCWLIVGGIRISLGTIQNAGW